MLGRWRGPRGGGSPQRDVPVVAVVAPGMRQFFCADRMRAWLVACVRRLGYACVDVRVDAADLPTSGVEAAWAEGLAARIGTADVVLLLRPAGVRDNVDAVAPACDAVRARYGARPLFEVRYGATPLGEVRYVGVWPHVEGLLWLDDEGFSFDADRGRPLYWQAAERAVEARMARLLGRTPQA